MGGRSELVGGGARTGLGGTEQGWSWEGSPRRLRGKQDGVWGGTVCLCSEKPWEALRAGSELRSVQSEVQPSADVIWGEARVWWRLLSSSKSEIRAGTGGSQAFVQGGQSKSNPRCADLPFILKL